MREYKPELHPEFSDRWRATADSPLSREADYQDTLNIFRANIASLFAEIDITDDLQWMMFTLGKESPHPESDRRAADLLVLLLLQQVTSPDGSLTICPSIRLLYSELYAVDGTKDFFTIDVTVDQDGDSQCLVDAYPMTSDGYAKDSLVPIAFIDEDRGLVITPNYKPYTQIPDIHDSKDDMLLPFGHYGHPLDKQQALEKAVLLLGLSQGRVPFATGDSFIFSEVE